MRLRSVSLLVSSLLLLTAACSPRAAHAPASPSEDPAALAALADDVCSLPHELLLRIWRGTRTDRSGEIQIVPAEPNFVSGGLSHAGPWDYVQRVPMLWYGRGYVRPGVRIDDPVTLADIAPTQAELLGFPFDAPDGEPLTEALVPRADRPAPPRLVVTLIWDAAGRNVLDAWPDSWPNLASLIPDGAWFPNATVGASPANTPPSHSTIGTGAFPLRTGAMDEYMRYSGNIEKPYEDGPGSMLLPTLGDLYDRSMGNEPVLGTVATLDPHVGMMSHGALWGGGDRDIAVTRELEESETGGAEGFTWNLTRAMSRFYRLPPYVADLPGIEREVRELDAADGALDGKWRGSSIEQLKGGFDTPARTPYQTRLIEAVVKREGFGGDDVPDLLFLNYKAIDTIGHMFSVNGPEMSDAVRVQDADLAELVAFLDRRVGERRWVMVVTADHGHQFDPLVSGAFEIGIDELRAAVTATFDDGDEAPVVEWVRPTQIWLDVPELQENRHTLVDVSRYVMGLTQADTVGPGRTIAAGHEDDRVFAAAFPSSMLRDLPCLPEARA